MSNEEAKPAQPEVPPPAFIEMAKQMISQFGNLALPGQEGLRDRLLQIANEAEQVTPPHPPLPSSFMHMRTHLVVPIPAVIPDEPMVRPVHENEAYLGLLFFPNTFHRPPAPPHTPTCCSISC